ncbi:MAG: PIN domain-containing protein [Candidatus Thiodiazotropha sp.]
MLDNLRQVIQSYSDLEKYIGSIFQLRLVIDTNAVISDLLWMARRKREENKTAIIEVIQAGTLIAYAPVQLKYEIEEHLPKIANKKNIPFEKIQNEWLAYQQYLEFIEIDEEELIKYENSVDPKDAPFVILSEILNVAGVISNDPHIEQLGGKRIALDIRLSLRDYSRTAAVAFSIRLGGVALSYVSVGLLAALGKGVGKLLQAIINLPDKAKMLLIAGLVLVFLMPSTRSRLFAYFQSVKGLFGETWEQISPSITELIQDASEKGKEAELKLQEIETHLTQNH